MFYKSVIKLCSIFSDICMYIYVCVCVCVCFSLSYINCILYFYQYSVFPFSIVTANLITFGSVKPLYIHRGTGNTLARLKLAHHKWNAKGVSLQPYYTLASYYKIISQTKRVTYLAYQLYQHVAHVQWKH